MADRKTNGYMEKNELARILTREKILKSIKDYDDNGQRDYGGRGDNSRSYYLTYGHRNYPLRMLARMAVEREYGADCPDIRVAHARDILAALGFECHHTVDDHGKPRVY